MNIKFTIADSIEMEKRKKMAEEFYWAILDPYEHPLLVTDEVSLLGITLDDESILMEKIKNYYGIQVSAVYLKKPFWELLDFLERNRMRLLE